MSSKIFLCAIVFISILSSTLVASDLGYEPGELIVRFAPKPDSNQRTISERNGILAAVAGGTVKDMSKFVPGLTLVKLPESLSVKNALTVFKNVTGILYAEPNYRIKSLSTFPNDPNFDQQWALHNTGQTHPAEGGGISFGTPDADIDAPEAWDISTDSDIIVAVIDTGVDYNHPDLAGNMWVNPGEIPGNGLDDDGNVYIDDIYGYDFCTRYGKERDSDPMDDDWHGTHIAGIIGAVGNNGEGVAGVCWNVKIMAVKLTTYDFYGNTWDAIAAIGYAVKMGAKVLSNSWGVVNNEYSQSLKEAIEAADANGVLFVAAAANFGRNNDLDPFYPASYDCNNIIAVMATNHNDEWWWRSSYGANSVDLAAPGSDILSTTPTFMTSGMAYYGLSTYYGTISGTSMATPRVAGACALVWMVNPTLRHLQVKQIILNTVDKLDALDDLCVTGGRLNLYNAVLEATKHQQLISKDDGLAPNASVTPDDEITYTISYANPVTDPNDPNYLGDLNNVVVVDYLPEEVDYNSSGPCGIYNPYTRTVFWDIGTLSPGEPNHITLSVNVNQLAEPLGTITNLCVFEANEIHHIFATEITDVNFWNPGVIYVDMSAPGSDTGMSWTNAYRDLQDALERAAASCGSEIWVAAGTYRPSEKVCYGDVCSVTFQLVNCVPIYGGFAGNETSRSQRNWLTNQTILTGDIDNDGDGDAVCVVTASNDVGPATIIDGFTIIKGSEIGIYCNGGSPTIAHNTIKENYYDGIYCDGASPTITQNTIEQNNWEAGVGCINNSSPDIKDCLIQNNSYGYGIYGLNSQLIVSNSIIRFNGYQGIYLNNMLSTTIKNNWINNNGYDGILFNNQVSVPIVRNNTIYANSTYGIESDQYGAVPNISNCIIYGNGIEDLSWAGTVNYCCLQSTHSGTGNIYGDPCFMNPDDPNDLHIDVNSPCKNEGNPYANYNGETDIDGEDRVKYGRVDIGGDEYYWSPADFDGNDIVNFIDYAIFANAWMSYPGDPNWNPDCNIGTPINNYIDYNDLAVFCEDWLWQAGWIKPFICGAGEGMGQTMAAGFAPAAVSYPSVLAEQQIEKVEPLKIEQLIKWLEELWLDEETQKLIDKDTWLKFIESVKEEL